MLLLKTYLAPSTIHGVGVFSEDHIPQGAVVWQWHEGIDRRIAPDVVEALPPFCQDFLKRYGWIEGGQYTICIDNERFINHSDTPNCVFSEDGTQAIAARDILAGEEITQDYRTFDEKWGSPEFGYDWP